MSGSLKNKALKGSIWSAMERFWVHGVQFLVMLVVARILSPEDYGLVGMLAIFIIVSQTLVDSGFGQALIRKKDRNEVDCSTIFYFNIVLGVQLKKGFFVGGKSCNPHFCGAEGVAPDDNACTGVVCICTLKHVSDGMRGKKCLLPDQFTGEATGCIELFYHLL